VILVDSNVLLDLIVEDPRWAKWSQQSLDEWGRRGPILINAIIYAELAPEYDLIEDLDAAIATVRLEYREIPKPALFLAVKAHTLYRRRGGVRLSVLPDFFVGAHAAVLGVTLLTRDPKRYKSYFPTVRVISPETEI